MTTLDDVLITALDVSHNMWGIELLGGDLHFPSPFLAAHIIKGGRFGQYVKHL